MSAPPSPHFGHSSKRNTINNKRDRPEALDILDEARNTHSDGDVRYERENLPSDDKTTEQSHHFNLNIIIPEESIIEPEQPNSRSTSATSSLDPYYFGIQSESESPLPPPQSGPMYLSTTPDHQSHIEPVTPARNAASIDRRGLVGVGELATPRWARSDSGQEDLVLDTPADEYDLIVPEDVEEEDQPDSPWTIEAVDGETSEKEDLPNLQLEPPRPLRTRPSIADESGGEEILYPRGLNTVLVDASKITSPHLNEEKTKLPREYSTNHDTNASMSPPSAFNQSTRKTRKRTSGEFELDQTGNLVTKQTGNKDTFKDDKATRKHRSLNISTSSPRDVKGKERRRESSGMMLSNGIKTAPILGKTPDRHVRQTSSSSAASSGPEHARRVQQTAFSHLPPSPSSSSIQQFLRSSTIPPASQPSSLHRASKDNLHSSPNVAHALLRGNHEGWNLEDEATQEAFRKLDGTAQSGRGARARASVGSFGRPSSSSRPGTPAGKSGNQWEGVNASDSGKSKRGSGNLSVKEKGDMNIQDVVETSALAVSSDEQPSIQHVLDKTPKKPNASTRLSFTPKRGSTSSTTYASTPSSRDSASMSATTSVTSVSAASGRHSSNKARRNSASSDISRINSPDAGAVNGEVSEEKKVPPMPPLPKDLSTFRSPPSTATGLTFPPIPSDDHTKVTNTESRTTSLEVPAHGSPAISFPTTSPGNRESQYYTSVSETVPPVLKTPSKKWSFSALNLKLSGSPSSSSQKPSSFPLSPRAVTFGQQLRKSTSKEQPPPISSASAKAPWSPNQPEAMASEGSLTSLSSIGSVRTPAQLVNMSKTPDRHAHASRPGTGSSVNTSHTTSALSAPPAGPLSPSSSVRRNPTKRLTPSSIPFFRRSSSQSMQLPPSNDPQMSTSPPYTGLLPTSQKLPTQSTSPSHDYSSISTSTPGTTQKKSSMLSLGLPSLLKSSSRRSLHADAKDSARESEKERIKQEKERQKKEDKDRSESRISVIINRKRGKTLSSAEPRKAKSPVSLPPMQMSALEPVTAQRVAKLKSSSNATASTSRTSTSSTSSSRLTAQTVSSMQKQSDTSLRARNQLPTIAGSPSVGTTGTSSSQTLKDITREPPSTLMNSTSGLPKETPTKIPRISSRSSAVSSPPLKHSTSALASRRTSHLVATSSANASPVSLSTNEFGVIENEDGATPKVRQTITRGSPASSTTHVSRQSTIVAPSTQSTGSTPRKGSRDSVSFIGLRKSSTNSVASLSAPAPTADAPTHHHRFSVLSPSKGLKLLAPKSSVRASTSTLNQSVNQSAASPSPSRQSGSGSTPSPVPSFVDEEEILGDEEMLHYIRRQHAKKLAAGASQAELDEMLKFPEPVPPGTPSSPASVLKSSQAQFLSEFERKEILDYPSVYCIGANSKKKLAVLDNPNNNYGYDDERGDYLVVNHDHLAYRYEIIDTLGKGSFGQVLHCRDHCTGESVAVKIIRNKKRFHHQALVEIKILDNLRKWDSEEKHHVIKMTEHFYFRNHLCIAMELLSINLYELIKANGFAGFTTALIRRFTSQMLLSLTLMRHHRIVHCDLKPENVLLRHPAKSGIKVIDFGSSCFEHEKIYTYIQSRFYRSPEVILGMNYHMAIDMWSLGCILAELYTGFPLFPGENEQEQLSCIMEVLGVPDKEFVNRSSRRKLFFDTSGQPRIVANSKGKKRKPGYKTLAQVLKCNDEEFVDFIAKCLIWDPERRMKPQTAMRHPFITSGRRNRPQPPTSKSTASSSSLSTRGKQVPETPKKSLISAPTPLTARSSRTATATSNGVPTTPNHSHTQALGSNSTQTSRSYRHQSQSLSALHSSRTLSGYASSSTNR